MKLLSLPPVRGGLSLLFLVLLGAVPASNGDLPLGARLGLMAGIVLLGAPVWMMTMSGFLRHVRTAPSEADPALLAWRPRRAAVASSWAALLGVGVGLTALGSLVTSDGGDLPLLAALLAAGVGLPLAMVLPRLSRWYALRQGTVWVDESSLIVRSAQGSEEIRVRWGELGGADLTPRPASILPPAARELLGSGVRWRPGARAAIARWLEEGFSPTLDEVRSLDLAPGWSDDPRAELPTRTERVTAALVGLWMFSVLSALLVGTAFAVLVGDAPWWVLAVFGLPALLALAILVPRAWRSWRTESRSAHLDAAGWVDLFHSQGRIPWEHIARIEVRGRTVLLVSAPDAPPFRDRDVGNRLNAAVERLQAGSPVRIRSAGPGFREIGPRHLSYGPATGVHRLVHRASALGGVEVRRAGR